MKEGQLNFGCCLYWGHSRRMQGDGDYRDSKEKARQYTEKPHHKATKLKSKFYLFLDVKGTNLIGL